MVRKLTESFWAKVAQKETDSVSSAIEGSVRVSILIIVAIPASVKDKGYGTIEQQHQISRPKLEAKAILWISSLIDHGHYGCIKFSIVDKAYDA